MSTQPCLATNRRIIGGAVNTTRNTLRASSRKRGLIAGIFQAAVATTNPEEAEEQAGLVSPTASSEDERPQIWEEFGHRFEPEELETLKRSITEMALSRIEGQDELYVGG